MTDKLLDVIREKGVLRGEFKLSSGGTSSYYFDMKRVTLDPEGAALFAERVLDLIDEFGEIAGVGGPPIGAHPMAGAVAAVSHLRGRPLRGFLLRKEAKGHGTRSRIENAPPEGSRVLLVEDVVTTGRSTLEAVRAVEEEGYVVAGVLSLVDRDQGGREALKDYLYRPLYTAKQALGE
jgi:orotate phosphoribosyltransferase